MDEMNEEGIAWPSFVDFLSTFIFVLFLFIGSMLYLQAGDIETSEFLQGSKDLREGLDAEGIESYIRGRTVVIPLKNQVKFEINQSTLTAEHKAFLRKIGARLRDAIKCRRIVVVGYADATPFKNDPFGNWRLSSARAQNVLEFFHTCEDCGFAGEIKQKLVLSGEGATGSSSTVPDQAARRVDIIIDYTDASGR